MGDRKQTFAMIKEKDPKMDLSCFKRFIPETKELIRRMLIKNPNQRSTPEEALKHDYFKKLGFVLDQPESPEPKLDLIDEEEETKGNDESNEES